MPCGKKNYCAMCHNFKPSLIIIMDDGNQYFEKNINFMSKIIHSAKCHGCQCHGIHSFECSSMYLIFNLISVHS
jgi:hypothetical protein